MSSRLSLCNAFLLAVAIGPISAQVPATAPACVRTCATVKVSEGYCSTATVFPAAYVQCLRDNCNAADQATGNQLTNSICGATAGIANSTNPAPPVAPLPVPLNPNGTANGTAVGAANGTAVGPTNGTANGTIAGNSTDFATTVTTALRAAGLGSLATALSSAAGAAYLSQLQQGQHTVFAPSDSALAALPVNSTSQADLTALLEYHTVPGTLDVSRLSPTTHSLVRTSLRGAPYVNLPANDSQVLVLASQPNGTLDIIEPTSNITAGPTSRLGAVQLTPIPTLLTVPGTIGATAAKVPQLSSLVAAINGSAPQLFGELDQTPGLTIFAPINSVLGGALPNGTNFQSILLNHIVNGTVLYSTVLANVTNATSAGGAQISFSANGTGLFASAADKTVEIVQSDIITRNGVIHLVNGLFNPSNSTPTFPLVNQNNATETVGITQVDGSNTTTAAQNARSAAQPRFNLPFTSFGPASLIAALNLGCSLILL